MGGRVRARLGLCQSGSFSWAARRLSRRQTAVGRRLTYVLPTRRIPLHVRPDFAAGAQVARGSKVELARARRAVGRAGPARSGRTRRLAGSGGSYALLLEWADAEERRWNLPPPVLWRKLPLMARVRVGLCLSVRAA